MRYVKGALRIFAAVCIVSFLLSSVPLSEEDVSADTVPSIVLDEPLTFDAYGKGEASVQKINDLAGDVICTYHKEKYSDEYDLWYRYVTFCKSVTISMNASTDLNMFIFDDPLLVIEVCKDVVVTLNYGEDCSFTSGDYGVIYAEYSFDICGEGTLNIHAQNTISGKLNGIYVDTTGLDITDTTVSVISDNGTAVVLGFSFYLTDGNMYLKGKDYGFKFTSEKYTHYFFVTNSDLIIIGEIRAFYKSPQSTIEQGIRCYCSDNIDGTDLKRQYTLEDVDLGKYLKADAVGSGYNSDGAGSGGSGTSTSVFSDIIFWIITIILIGIFIFVIVIIAKSGRNSSNQPNGTNNNPSPGTGIPNNVQNNTSGPSQTNVPQSEPPSDPYSRLLINDRSINVSFVVDDAMDATLEIGYNTKVKVTKDIQSIRVERGTYPVVATVKGKGIIYDRVLNLRNDTIFIFKRDPNDEYYLMINVEGNE